MRIIDISDPFHPVEISSVPTNEYAVGVAVSEPTTDGRTYAYVAGERRLHVIDVTNPLIPTEISHVDVGLGYFSDVATKGNYLYLTRTPYYDPFRQVHNGGLQLMDVSNPAQHSYISFFEISGIPYQVEISGDYTYLAQGDRGLRVIDVGNLLKPIEVGYFISGTANDITMALYVTEHYIFSANKVYDKDNPSAGVLILRLSFPVYLPIVNTGNEVR